MKIVLLPHTDHKASLQGLRVKTALQTGSCRSGMKKTRSGLSIPICCQTSGFRLLPVVCYIYQDDDLLAPVFGDGTRC